MTLFRSSDPRSEDYGKHYTQQQVTDTFAPAPETVEAVKSWLIAAGIPKDSIRMPKSQGWITFETTTSKLESLLNTKYNEYTHRKSDGTFIGTDEYKLPVDVADHVDFISPGTSFTTLKKGRRTIRKGPIVPAPKERTSSAASTCPTKITPDCLRAMYNFSKGTTKDASNDLGIFEEAGEMFIQSDLNQFYSKYASYVPSNTRPKNVPINGQTFTQDSGEADLDYEMAVPIIYPQGTVNYEVGSDANSFEELVDDFLQALDGSFCNDDGGECGTQKATNVISISYGDDEVDYTSSFLNVSTPNITTLQTTYY